jgi:hypothetical protein
MKSSRETQDTNLDYWVDQLTLYQLQGPDVRLGSLDVHGGEHVVLSTSDPASGHVARLTVDSIARLKAMIGIPDYITQLPSFPRDDLARGRPLRHDFAALDDLSDDELRVLRRIGREYIRGDSTSVAHYEETLDRALSLGFHSTVTLIAFENVGVHGGGVLEIDDTIDVLIAREIIINQRAKLRLSGRVPLTIVSTLLKGYETPESLHLYQIDPKLNFDGLSISAGGLDGETPLNKPDTPPPPPPAPSGADAHCSWLGDDPPRKGGDGSSGRHGLWGIPGGAGGNAKEVSIKVQDFAGGLLIDCTGGNGGFGGPGGDGAPGGDGGDAGRDPERCEDPVEGGWGGWGGWGGRGGPGGNGGDGALCIVNYLTLSAGMPWIYVDGGKGGDAGRRPGQAGRGGAGGWDSYRQHRAPSRNGNGVWPDWPAAAGVDGKDGKQFVIPQNPH